MHPRLIRHMVCTRSFLLQLTFSFDQLCRRLPQSPSLAPEGRCKSLLSSFGQSPFSLLRRRKDAFPGRDELQREIGGLYVARTQKQNKWQRSDLHILKSIALSETRKLNILSWSAFGPLSFVRPPKSKIWTSTFHGRVCHTFTELPKRFWRGNNHFVLRKIGD